MTRCGKNCNFSELNVLRNAISFPLCNEMESLWKRYWVSNGSMVICDIHLPRSDRISVASMLMNPPVLLLSAQSDVFCWGRNICLSCSLLWWQLHLRFPPFRQFGRRRTYSSRWNHKLVAYREPTELALLRPNAFHPFVIVLSGLSLPECGPSSQHARQCRCRSTANGRCARKNFSCKKGREVLWHGLLCHRYKYAVDMR